MTAVAPLVIDQPGIYDIPAAAYHADPVPGGSLSSTGARQLLAPSCPAKFRWQANNGRLPKREFDLGHAAHRLVLGDGDELEIIDAENYRTKAAQAARNAAHDAGRVPLLTAEYEQVQAMAAALRDHPTAAAVFDPDSGEPERSLFWHDAEFGVWRRARLDWLRLRPAGGRLIVPDYKTCASAEPAALSRAMQSYGYYQQGAWYLDAVTALGLAGDVEPAFLLVCQEREPPYLVTICQPNPDALNWGRVRNRKALDLFRQCQTTGHWPGYAEKPVELRLPRWAEYEHDVALVRGDYDIETEVNTS